MKFYYKSIHIARNKTENNLSPPPPLSAALELAREKSVC